MSSFVLDAKPKGDFRAHASSNEAALRKRMPGLFASTGSTRGGLFTSSGAARAPRGPPKNVNTLLTGAAAEAKAAAKRATSMLTAMEKVPWPSDVEQGNDPSDEPPPVFGPDLPTGDAAVLKLLGEDLAGLMEAKLSRTRDAMDDAIYAMRAAEPIDPNASRPSPNSRAAIIASQVDAELATRPRPPPDEGAKLRKAKVLSALVREEAEARAKLRGLADDAARVQAEMALFKSEFIMYEKGPYVTQLADADDDELDEAQEEPSPFCRSPPRHAAPRHAQRETGEMANVPSSSGASARPCQEHILDEAGSERAAVETPLPSHQHVARSAAELELEHEPAWEAAKEALGADDGDDGEPREADAPRTAEADDMLNFACDAAAQPGDRHPPPTRFDSENGAHSVSGARGLEEEEEGEGEGEDGQYSEDEYAGVDIMAK